MGVDYSDAQLADSNEGGQTGTPTAGGVPTSQTGDLCAPKTCAALNAQCGVQNDGCGNAIDCGACAGGGECRAGACACTASTCPQAGASCGTVADGCGNVLDCGRCANPADGCTDGACACVPKTCAEQGVACGRITDGCGNELTCGTCDDPALPYCTAGTCTAAECHPQDCAQLGKNCNAVSDGCGDLVACGGCTAPQSCGGGGVANVCGCTPLTCAQLGASCGDYPDGCGGTVSCGGCAAPQSCGGGGTAKACGCTPSVVACPAGQNCGTVPDGCGGNVACGQCALPDNTCSGNVCSCAPSFCDATCGYGTDNCGNSCYSGVPCGGGGGCFAAGTLVRMADGSSRPIETVQVGELVASFDARTGESHATRVTRALVHGPDSSRDGFVVVDGVLRVTPNHPLLVNGRRAYAGDLHAGDEVLTPPALGALRRQSSVALAAIPHRTQRIEHVPGAGMSTYDLQTEDGIGFYADGVVVLRKPVDPQEPLP